jgi:sugar transferase (PEP-CTERM/EpsH1 system associated)
MQDLLFLAHRIPYPPNKGDKIRSYHLLKYLSLNYKVHLATFIDDPNDWQYTDKLDALCASTCYIELKPLLAKIKSVQGLLTGDPLSLPYYKNKRMQAWVNQTLSSHSRTQVLIFSSVMAQYINQVHDVEMVVDFVDVDSDKWRQYAQRCKGLMHWIYQREAQYLLGYEKIIAQQARASIFVSEQEAELFKTLAPEVNHKVTHINNGVDTEYFSPELSFNSPYADYDQVIVFTGAMDYWANVDAVVWFANAIFPLIVKRQPYVKFYIVGSKPTKEVLALATNAIIVTGGVDDIRPYLAHAHLVVAPLRIARGIQNKVLEAMAMEKYVVATTAAMEGIALKQELAVSVADSIENIAHEISEQLQKNLPAHQNRDFVLAQFSWEHNAKQLLSLLQVELPT